MSERRIAIPASLRAEIKRQAVLPPSGIQPDEREAFVASLPADFRVAGEAHLNNLADLDEHNRWAYITGEVATIRQLLQEGEAGRFQKPLLTIEDAAAMLSLSPKRFENIICEERAKLGRTPDFIVDADGRIQRRVLRDELLAWARGRRRASGRRHGASVRKQWSANA